MEAESVIYTDGREVKVTTSKLIVGKKEYLLTGVTAFRLQIIKAARAVPIVLVLAGLIIIVLGLMHMLPADLMNPVNFGGKMLSVNDVAAFGGAILVLIGIIWMVSLHDRYAVQISTADGNKDVIISTKRDYVDQIVTALGVALTPMP